MFRRLWLSLLAGFSLGLLPEVTSAATGAQALAAFIEANLVQQALIAFWGIAAAFLLYYSIRMILEAQKDSALTDGRQSFVYAFFGFAVIASAGAFTITFTQGTTTEISGALGAVALFLIRMGMGIFVLMVTLAGFGMVLSQGDQAAFDKWRKVLVANSGGVILMMIASTIVLAIGTPQGGGTIIANELIGLANFILTIFAFGCAIALIIAGVMLIISVDESLKDRAKKTIIGTLITLAFVLAARALLATFAVGT